MDVRDAEVPRLRIPDFLEHATEVIREISDDAAKERIRRGSRRRRRQRIHESSKDVERMPDDGLLAPWGGIGPAASATPEPSDRIGAQERVARELRIPPRGIEEERGPTALHLPEEFHRVAPAERSHREPKARRHRSGIEGRLVKF